MKSIKKTIFNVLVFIMTVGLCSCSSQKVPDDVEVVHAHVQRIVYEDFTSLLEHSDVVLFGSFTKDADEKIIHDENGLEYDALAVNYVKVDKVYKGTINEKSIKVMQRYGYDDKTKRRITFSSLSPMVKGDKWLFFLKYDEENGGYWCAGDYTGRYPMLSDELQSFYDIVAKIYEEKDQLFEKRASISAEEAEKRYEQGEESFCEKNGKIYPVTKEEAERLKGNQSAIEEKLAALSPNVFGLYDSRLFQAETWYDVINWIKAME